MGVCYVCVLCVLCGVKSDAVCVAAGICLVCFGWGMLLLLELRCHVNASVCYCVGCIAAHVYVYCVGVHVLLCRCWFMHVVCCMSMCYIQCVCSMYVLWLPMVCSALVGYVYVL